MAKSAAERKRESRENKLKQSGKKDITFSLDTAVIEIVTSHSKELGLTQSNYVNDKLKTSVTSHSNSQTELDRLNAMADTCYQCVKWQDDKCSNGLVLTGFCCDGFKSLRAELDRYKAGNTKLVEQRDNEHNQVIRLQTELRTAKTEPAKLKAELSAAKRELFKQKTRFCQCLTAAGHQCTKPATHENKHNGFILWTCEQHYQSVINAN